MNDISARDKGRRAADDGVSGLLTAAEAVPPQDQNQANADGVRAGGGLLGGGSGSPGGNHRGGGGGEEAGIPIGMGGDGVTGIGNYGTAEIHNMMMMNHHGSMGWGGGAGAGYMMNAPLRGSMGFGPEAAYVMNNMGGNGMGSNITMNDIYGGGLDGSNDARNSNNNGEGGVLETGDGEEDSINYLAARAHAAQMLAAEESKRLEENLMRLEMRRMMGGFGGSGEGGGAQGNNQGGDPSVYNQDRVNTTFSRNNSNNGSSNPSNDDHLFERAQRFSMSQNGPTNNMMSMNNVMMRGFNYFNGGVLGMGMMNFNQGNSGFFGGGVNNVAMPNIPGNSNFPQDNGMHSSQKHSTQDMNHHDAKPSKKAKTSKIKSNNDDEINPPRRPLSAYNIFFSELREYVLKEGPDTEQLKDYQPKERSLEEMRKFTEELIKKRLDTSGPKRPHRKSE